jgi:hypothetical protein
MHFTSKWKAEQRDKNTIGSFNPTSYTPDDGQLGRNMQFFIMRRDKDIEVWILIYRRSCRKTARSENTQCSRMLQYNIMNKDVVGTHFIQINIPVLTGALIHCTWIQHQLLLRKARLTLILLNTESLILSLLKFTMPKIWSSSVLLEWVGKNCNWLSEGPKHSACNSRVNS